MKFSPCRGPRALINDRGGNVALLFALAAIPLFVALAAAVDYARAAKVRGDMAAIADAAVLAATTPAMMTQSTTIAKQAAIDMFTAQARTVSGMTFDANSLAVTVTDTTSSTATQRAVGVTYTGQADNAFGAFFIAKNTSGFSVSASAATTTAPNIDLYMLIDNSPSMLLPATSAGVAKMVQDTGCAFACHENNMADTESRGYAGYGTIDSYTYAKNSGIALRIDNVKDAVKRVAATAMNTMATNGASYRMGVYGFNYGFAELQNLITTTSAHQNNIYNSVAAMLPPLMDSNNALAGNQKLTYPTSNSTWTEVSLNSTPVNNNDAMTDFTMAMTKMNAAIAAPGNGTNQNGDKPQGVLMIVTDGVVDAGLYSSVGCNTTALPYTATINGASYSFNRCQQPIDTAVCTTIKNRSIRIAVLYTTYQPMTGYYWYDQYVAPYIGQVEPALRACASSSDLYAQVTTGGDIQAELDKLFTKVVSSAPRLTN